MTTHTTTVTIADRDRQIRYTVGDDEITRIEIFGNWFSPLNEPAKWHECDSVLFELLVEWCWADLGGHDDKISD